MSEYEDLVELGFEGLDKFANKYHDKVYPDGHGKRRSGPGGKKHGAKEVNARSDKQEQPEPLQKSRSHGDDPRMTYAPDGERERDWGGSDRDGGHAKSPRAEDRGYYEAPCVDSVVLARSRNVDDRYGGYPVAPPAPSPPYGYGAQPPGPAYNGGWDSNRSRPMPMRRRSSSYSPPRRDRGRRRHSSPRRARSKSPTSRITATVVGALAGGLIGNAAKSNNPWSAVAGAVVGGVGAREAEKLYDRRKDREIVDDERRQRRRRERECEREQWRG